jgi:hypothetical protein
MQITRLPQPPQKYDVPGPGDEQQSTVEVMLGFAAVFQ